MAGKLEDKRRDLDRVYDHLERLEHDGADRKLLQEYRALSRKLADEIIEMEQRGGA